ncbi:HvfB family MNIO-type RiPP peptide maturase [Pseudoalteromonas sp. T1lg65]|uniref:HvfB family MNIO-type RiPP peptide maturase n=1 Tax=Pseudoalteromonas sp. T1lg65 TaxID=2077101 RepID=UPI003F79C0F7
MTSPIGNLGLGLRREMLDDILQSPPQLVDFYEVAPENWMKFGGRLQKQFRQLTEAHTFVCHGLSLSLGSPEPLDVDFVKALKVFFKQHNISTYSEHLSYCSGLGHMYDLMPIPFTEDAIKHTAQRIRQVQDILEMPIAVENVSYYGAPGQELSELEFTLAVLEQADCKLLLDVNNIYVNATNHGYDPEVFLRAMPTQRIAYGHVAGHYQEAEDLLVDTHGATVCDPVWALLGKAYEIHGLFPTLLERDFNIPPLPELLSEVSHIERLQHAQLKQGAKHVV